MKLFLCLLLLTFASTSYATAILFPAPQGETARLTIASNTDTFAISPIIRAFQSENPNIAVLYDEHQSNSLFEQSQKACRENSAFADIIISSAMAQQYRLANDGCAADLSSNRDLTQLIEQLPEWAKWSNELVGLTFEPAAMVVNRARFAHNPPKSHLELIDLLTDNISFRGRIGEYDPSRSGVGLLFAYADTLSSTSATKLQIYFEANAVERFCCTSQIIDLVADGQLDIGYNVLGSYALFRAERDPRLQVIFLEDFTPVLSRVAFVSKSSKQPEIAQSFISFMLSDQGRRLFERGSRLMPSRGGEALISAYLDQPIGFLKPIALSPELLIIHELLND